jgi:hypothetical protein
MSRRFDRNPVDVATEHRRNRGFGMVASNAKVAD